MTREEAKNFVAAVVVIRNSVDDTTALSTVAVFPAWKTSTVYALNERVKFNNNLYKCLQPHTSQDAWTPDASSSLWAKILPGQSGTEIGEWAQPDSTNPYMKGDKVKHGGKVWISTIDTNTWEPGVYGWDEVTN